MADKKVRIQVWTDIYYAKFVGIWRPEEDLPLDQDDPRPSQEQNIPYLFVLSTMYKGRQEVIGNSPIAPSQHPMHPDILKKNIRDMCYLFANEIGIFKPPTKAHSSMWLEKQTVGYQKIKEFDVVIRPAYGSMTLKALRDHLSGYDEEWLEQHYAMIQAEHPDDAAERDLDEYIYTPLEPADEPDQYISITKLIKVYEVTNPYLNNFPVTPEMAAESLPPGSEDHPLSKEETAKTNDAIATNDAELALLKKHDEMYDALEVKRTLTKEEVQAELIKDLKKKNGDQLGGEA